MPNNQDSKKQWDAGQEPMLEPAQVDPIKKKVTKKPKPIVEGINSAAPDMQVAAEEPVASVVTPPNLVISNTPEKVELTDAEKMLMSPSMAAVKESPKEVIKPQIKVQKEDPRLMPQRVANRASRGANFLRNLLLVIIFLLIVVGGFELYTWYENRPSGVESVNYQGNQVVLPSITATPSQTVMATPTPSVTSVSVSATPTPVQSTKQLKINSTPTGYLNVRSQPATSGSLVEQVHPGDVLPYTQGKNGWYQVTLPDGKTGWVTGQYATLQ